jgi:hypothetical protein
MSNGTARALAMDDEERSQPPGDPCPLRPAIAAVRTWLVGTRLGGLCGSVRRWIVHRLQGVCGDAARFDPELTQRDVGPACVLEIGEE